MTGRAVADEVEGLIATQLGKDDPVRLHAQACFHARLGARIAGALATLRIQKMHHVGLLQEQLTGVFDGDQALVV
ncbi:hypothetical protein D3C73_808520 [compost metagenome]